ncbi:hypothetical protein P154DRAFT_577058 [Amniculicola lignicola CBS 123094]|uniref:Uncharacterized protein n=1 Tax=Amniculicola lignicola CBS 123094 TaxID=1392246 RepID=A0A6A5WP06_9PLEO|nr:hypothetical protein P154DRAFT_577058 [Amniculicola lignicola CBS 123094]
MASPPSESIWFLLSPHSLPPASEIPNLLGAITLSYTSPLRETCPKHLPLFMRAHKDKLISPTSDENFHTLLSSTHSKEAHARLSAIAHLNFDSALEDAARLETLKVTTHALKNQHSLFRKLRGSWKAELEVLRADSLTGPTPDQLYMVVGIKTCHDASVSNSTARSRTLDADAVVPTGVEAFTAGPNPVPLRLGGGVTKVVKKEQAMTLTGERIFALQYLIVKPRRDWMSSMLRKRSNSLELGSEMRVSGDRGLMYGTGGEDEEDEDEEDDGEDNGDDDCLEVRSVQDSAELAGRSEAVVIVEW